MFATCLAAYLACSVGVASEEACAAQGACAANGDKSPSLLSLNRKMSLHGGMSEKNRKTLLYKSTDIVSLPFDDITAVKRTLISGEGGFESMHKVAIWVKPSETTAQFWSPTGFLIDMEGSEGKVSDSTYSLSTSMVASAVFEENDDTFELLEINDVGAVTLTDLVNIKRVKLTEGSSSSFHRVFCWARDGDTTHLFTPEGYRVSSSTAGVLLVEQSTPALGTTFSSSSFVMTNGDESELVSTADIATMSLKDMLPVKRVLLYGADSQVSGHKVISWAESSDGCEEHLYTQTGYLIKITDGVASVTMEAPVHGSMNVEKYTTDDGELVENVLEGSIHDLKSVQKVVLKDEGGCRSMHKVFVWTKPTQSTVHLRSRSGFLVEVDDSGAATVSRDDHDLGAMLAGRAHSTEVFQDGETE